MTINEDAKHEAAKLEAIKPDEDKPKAIKSEAEKRKGTRVKNINMILPDYIHGLLPEKLNEMPIELKQHILPMQNGKKVEYGGREYNFVFLNMTPSQFLAMQDEEIQEKLVKLEGEIDVIKDDENTDVDGAERSFGIGGEDTLRKLAMANLTEADWKNKCMKLQRRSRHQIGTPGIGRNSRQRNQRIETNSRNSRQQNQRTETNSRNSRQQNRRTEGNNPRAREGSRRR